jgi:hypothetical protein
MRRPVRPEELMMRGSSEWRRWIQERMQCLPFWLRSMETQVALGALVLVIAGEGRNDVGEMATVSG